MDHSTLAKLEGDNFEYFMKKRRINIGRDSKQGNVDINMGATRLISRKHLEISYEGNKFYILCRGKNGVFVDDTLHRREAKRMELPSLCILRFPSTQTKIQFRSFLSNADSATEARPSSPLPPSSAFQSPYITPVASPTGTISVVNSCPSSPAENRPRLPSFDLMARYASKLLTEGRGASDSEGGEGEEGGMPNNNHHRVTFEDAMEGDHPTTGSSGDSSPVDQNGTGPSTGGSVSECPEETTIPATTTTSNAHTTSTNSTPEDTGATTNNPDERIGKDGKKYTKPLYSYAQLIVQALLSSKDRRQTLNSIYQFISEKYPYYRLEDKGWKNSIRHNLSLNQYFMKAPREREGLGFGKGGYWCMHPDYEDKLTSQAYVKRKKKGIPVFPSAGLMSRSAPPSPTHHHSTFIPDMNSIKERESSFVVRSQPSTVPPQFTLPSFFPRLTNTISHSLPPSPSRVQPSGFATPPFRYFPLGMRSSSTDALALESRHRLRENDGETPITKKPRLSNDKDVAEPQMMPAPKPVAMGPAHQSAIMPVATGMPIFSLPSLRFPFVGMPTVLAPPILPGGMSHGYHPSSITMQDNGEREVELDDRGEQ